MTHENVQLAVREGTEVVYLERIAGRYAVRVLTRVGGRFPAHATGVGLVLLAHAPADVLDAVLAGPLEPFTEKTIVSSRQLRRVLAEVRRSGVAISDHQVTMDALSVAAPVVGTDGTVVAALSLVVRAQGAQPSCWRRRCGPRLAASPARSRHRPCRRLPRPLSAGPGTAGALAASSPARDVCRPHSCAASTCPRPHSVVSGVRGLRL